MLKERRRLVIVAREAPLSGIQLRNMLTLNWSGAVIFPPVPAFYIKASSVDELSWWIRVLVGCWTCLISTRGISRGEMDGGMSDFFHEGNLA